MKANLKNFNIALEERFLLGIAKLSSSWQSSASRTDLALNLEITTPTYGRVEIQLELDYIWSADGWGMVWPTFTRLLV